jgi:hypothetical protein
MPHLDGLGLLEELRRLSEDVLVIVVTAFGEIETAVEAMRRGPGTSSRNPSTGTTSSTWSTAPWSTSGSGTRSAACGRRAAHPRGRPDHRRDEPGSRGGPPGRAPPGGPLPPPRHLPGPGPAPAGAAGGHRAPRHPLPHPSRRRPGADRLSRSAAAAGGGLAVPDETRVKTGAARVPGRIERLHAAETGTVVAGGEALVNLYSPDLSPAPRGPADGPRDPAPQPRRRGGAGHAGGDPRPSIRPGPGHAPGRCWRKPAGGSSWSAAGTSRDAGASRT